MSEASWCCLHSSTSIMADLDNMPDRDSDILRAKLY